MDICYIDTSDLGVEWLEEQRTKLSGSNPSTAYHKKSVEVELEQLPCTMKLELVGGFLELKQNFLLFFDLFFGILKIQITLGW
jgi:hypothetical protein